MLTTPRERLAAIGNTRGLPPALRAALDPSHFEPLPDPGPHDWLANHPEPGQTFDQFVASRPNRPTAQRRTIHIQPLGQMGKLDALRDFASAFFMLPVHVHDPVTLGWATIHWRGNQMLTTDILTLLKRRVPSDAFCVIAITMNDLYPGRGWNFVFGQASLRERVGVYSFARYADRDPHVVLRRSCKVLAHETSHMFGIEHCIYFRCVMNGSNNLAESDARPMRLCPVDLRKLQWSVGFDVVERAKRLEHL